MPTRDRTLLNTAQFSYLPLISQPLLNNRIPNSFSSSQINRVLRLFFCHHIICIATTQDNMTQVEQKEKVTEPEIAASDKSSPSTEEKSDDSKALVLVVASNKLFTVSKKKNFKEKNSIFKLQRLSLSFIY